MAMEKSRTVLATSDPECECRMIHLKYSLQILRKIAEKTGKERGRQVEEAKKQYMELYYKYLRTVELQTAVCLCETSLGTR